MTNATDDGILRGRPWGGVSILLQTSICRDVSFNLCEDRYVCIVLYDTCFINVYLPSGPNACLDILLDVISQLDILCTDVHNKYNTKNFVFGGDINVNITQSSRAAAILLELFARWSSTVGNSLIPFNLDYSYCHDSLGHRSFIDFFFISNSC